MSRHPSRSLIYLFFISSLFFTLTSSFTPSSEVSSLYALYNSTHGENWLWRGPMGQWDFNSSNIDPCGCAWQGIECNQAASQCFLSTCSIVKIELQNFFLRGQLPNDWRSLTSLTFLELVSNLLTGPLPQYFPPTLKILRFQTNFMTGTLPSTFGSLTNLLFLDLEVNRLTGSIPSSVGEMQSLEIFACDRNNFTMNLPSAFGKLTNLRRLDLEKNCLTGSIPSEIYSISTLQSIDFLNNEITGTISSLIGNLLSLRALDLENNFMRGPLPSEIGSLTMLTLLKLSGNSFTSTVPSQIWTFPNITRIDLSANSFEGSLPENLSASRLAFLFLQGNSFDGFIPTTFGDLTALVNIDLSVNQFDGTLPKEIGKLRRLTTIQVSGNHFTGTIPSSIGGMKALTWFELQDNLFNGSIPLEIGQLSNLRYIILPNCLLTGPLPCHSFPNLTSLTYLDTSLNYLTGSLCSEIGLMASLENLFSALNLHTGPIPESLGLLPSLQTVELLRNHLTGHIPSTIGSLSECVILSLAYNQLSGTVPSQLGTLQKLEQLYLQRNHLRGELHSLFWQSINGSRSMSLVNLDLSANIFSGQISPELFLIPTLETAAMTSNCFTGTLPTEICQADSLSVLSLDGLGVGKGCHMSAQFSAVYPQWRRSTWGTIPNCVWGMRNLTVLSLSGNGLEGTISSLSVDTKLINLTLSHNHLTGTIPSSLQRHPFVLLDLSFNKLTGEASSFVLPTNMSFRRVLEVNRLSGSLSSLSTDDSPSFRKTNALNFLNGNIFGCRSLPEDDVDYRNYLCGSSELDDAFTIFGGILAFLSLSLLLIFFLKREMTNTSQSSESSSLFAFFQETYPFLHKYYHYFDSKDLLQADGFLTTEAPTAAAPAGEEGGAAGGAVRGAAAARGGEGAAAPGGAAAGEEEEERGNKFAQVEAFSNSFRHMKYTVILVSVVGMVLTLPIYVLKGLDSHAYRTHFHLYRWMWTTAFIKSVLSASLLLIAWIISACVLMVMVDTTQQHTQHSNTQSNTHSNTQSGQHHQILSRKSTLEEINFTKLERYQKFFKVLTIVLTNFALVGTVNGFFIFSTLQDLTESTHFTIEISVSIFKIVWNSWILPFAIRTFHKEKSPRLLVMLTLFNTIFIPCVAATFTSTSCFQGVIVPSRQIRSTYTYSSCFSYAGFRRLISGDYLSWCLAYTDISVDVEPFRPHFYYNNLCGSTILQVYIPIYLYIYSILLFVPPVSIYLLSRFVEYESLPQWVKPFVPAIIWPVASEDTIRDSRSISSEKDVIPMISPLLFKRDNIAVSLMLHVALLLTFGLCSPILGLAIMIVTCLSITQWRILIARFVSLRSLHNKRLSLRKSQEDAVMNVLNRVVGDTAACFKSMLWAVLWMSCVFFAFLCWDIASDTVGWIQSCWIPVTAAISLPLFKFGYGQYQKYRSKLQFQDILERRWIKSLRNKRSQQSEEGLSLPHDLEGRSSEFGEMNPLRVTSLEMIQSSFSVALPSSSSSIDSRDPSIDVDDDGSVRHTI